MSQADDFFMRSLPRAILAQFEAFVAMRGRISIAVESQGAWTLELGQKKLPVRRGEEAADLSVWLSDAAFTGLLEGNLDVGAAAREGEVRAKGDLKLLQSLGRLMSPPQSPLQVRMSSRAT